jgi:hypothetical protein
VSELRVSLLSSVIVGNSRRVEETDMGLIDDRDLLQRDRGSIDSHWHNFFSVSSVGAGGPLPSPVSLHLLAHSSLLDTLCGC